MLSSTESAGFRVPKRKAVRTCGKRQSGPRCPAVLLARLQAAWPMRTAVVFMAASRSPQPGGSDAPRLNAGALVSTRASHRTRGAVPAADRFCR